MINLAICDDEAVEIAYLSALANQWAAARQTALSIATYSGAENYIVAHASEPDILLLDIQMGDMDGMGLARQIRRSNEAMQIIFITGYVGYMADGYEVDALHYLIKPVDEAKLFAALDKAVERLQKNDATLLVMSAGGETVRVKLADIIYIEALAHYVHIQTKVGAIETRAKISEMEAQLGEGFVRCHRSYIVGLRHVARIIKTDVVLDNGQIIPLSRRLYSDVNRTFIEFHTRGAE